MAGYPNVETVARDWLRTDLNAGVPDAQRIRVENEEPGNLPYTAKLVVVTEQPGGPGDTQLTLDVTDLQVDAYAGSRNTARDLAEQVRSALRLRFRRHTDPGTGAFVLNVQTLAKPVHVPSTISGSRLRMCTATYRLTVHASALT